MKRFNPDFIRLSDILSAISDIEAFAKTDFEDRKTVMAIAYSIAVIGEAANKLSPDLIAQNRDIPWKNIIGMRHRIIHDYGNVDVKNLKQVATVDLPVLKAKIQSILNSTPKY